MHKFDEIVGGPHDGTMIEDLVHEDVTAVLWLMRQPETDEELCDVLHDTLAERLDHAR
jgi:hypothetical protein